MENEKEDRRESAFAVADEHLRCLLPRLSASPELLLEVIKNFMDLHDLSTKAKRKETK